MERNIKIKDIHIGMTEKRGQSGSGSLNWYQNTKNLSGIMENQNAIAIFLDIASNQTRNYNQLSEDLNLELPIIAPLVKQLENSNLIEKNPSPTSQKFKLTFNGQLFAEQLKTICPKVEKILGEESLIEPIKIKTY